MACRIYGVSSSSSRDWWGGSGGTGQGSSRGNSRKSQTLNRITRDDLDFEKARTDKISLQSLESLFDLVNGKVEIKQEGEDDPKAFASPIQTTTQESLRDKLPLVLDMLTTKTETGPPARAQHHPAPREVILALPRLNEAQ